MHLNEGLYHKTMIYKLLILVKLASYVMLLVRFHVEGESQIQCPYGCYCFIGTLQKNFSIDCRFRNKSVGEKVENRLLTEAVCNLTELQELYVDNNQLTDLGCNNFCINKLKNLVILSVDFNRISQL